MRIWKTLLLALAPAVAWAAVCDETYHLQSISQSIYSGSDPKNLVSAKRGTVGADLSGLEFVDTNIAYSLLSKFESACQKTGKPVTFKNKGAGKKAFSDSVASDYKIQMFDSTTQVDGFKYDLWVGFFKPDSVLRMVLGKDNAKSGRFQSWYLAIAYKDSVPAGQLTWAVSTRYYSLAGPDDSLVLEKQVLDQTIRKVTLETNHRYHFTIQFLKVSYDSLQPAGLRARKKEVNGFHATQSGNLVLIRPGEKGAGFLRGGEPLSLYGMMGSKIATLHPTGYLYQWNGKTSAGAEAPTGVYFVQAGDRIVGKFFYTR